MNVLIYLVPMALLLGLTGLVAFLWSLRSGQYDDVEGAAIRILQDDDIELTQTGFDQQPHPIGGIESHAGNKMTDSMPRGLTEKPLVVQSQRVDPLK
jgi:cbb3-type cytochrome oxidase maturation protein